MKSNISLQKFIGRLDKSALEYEGRKTRRGRAYLAKLSGSLYIALKSFQKSAGMSQEGTVGPTAATLRNAACWWPRRPLHDHRWAVATLGIEKSLKEAILISCRSGTEELRNGWSGGTSNMEVGERVKVMQARQRVCFSANRYSRIQKIV